MAIMGILTALAIPIYTSTKERSMDSEAINGVRMIWEAERQSLQRRDYACTGNTASLNTCLSLDLSSVNWAYSASSSGSAPAVTVTITATRSGRTWTAVLSSGSYGGAVTPTCSGSGCP